MWTIPGLTETSGQARILNAALRCFAGKGFAATTMTDIAAEAGLSRTALYKHYRQREDVFRALSQRVNQGVRDAVVAAARQDGHLEQRLRAVLAARVGWAFEALHLSAHGRELIDAKNELCGASGTETDAQFRKLLAQIIARATGHDARRSDAEAGLITACLPGLIDGANREEDARERLQRFVAIFAAGLTAPKPKR
jgi:AcrR family transcriptional regulator